MIWKTSCTVPVPKKQPVKVMNDLRPVAFTSCVMKVFERVVHVHHQEQGVDFMDPLQLAYRTNRSVDDAILQVLNSIYSHLEKPGTCIRLVYDFSSAFNTIQPHVLSEKLLNMNVQASTIMWILAYLTNHPQFVKCSQNANLAVTRNLLLQNRILYRTLSAPTRVRHRGPFCRHFSLSVYSRL